MSHMESNGDLYGVCEYCGDSLIPIWFIEEETKIEYGHVVETGRSRRAVSHLTCPTCMKNYSVDDSFNGPWRRN